MNFTSTPFLNTDPEYHDPETAAAVVIPVPYERGVSWGKGAALGPASVIEASREVETYDEGIGFETCRMGIATAPPPGDLSSPGEMIRSVIERVQPLLSAGKFPVLIGGDHSVSVGFFLALCQYHENLSVIQIDAHADLRDNYLGDPMSHACVMSRIREKAGTTLQIGIRSMCSEEADLISRAGLRVFTMESCRNGFFDPETALDLLPDPVYLTLDVDALDWSVVRSTGTPEPGGFTWHEVLRLLEMIFEKRHVIAFDVMELSHNPEDPNSSYAAAKLVYKMLGFKLASHINKGFADWPDHPHGSLFS